MNLIEKRWKKSEEALRKALPSIKKLYRQLGDKVLNTFDEIDFDFKKANKNVPARVKRYVDDRIDFWKESGLLVGYLQYLAISHTWTYKSVVYLLIFGLYVETYTRLKKIAEDIFEITANDIHEQSAEERGDKKPDPIPIDEILAMAIIPLLMTSFFDYLDTLAIDQTDEMESFIMTYQMNQRELTDDLLLAFMMKQAARMLKNKKGRWSGAIEQATRVVGNSSYIYDVDPDQKVKFVAEIDDRTTKMCRSLNDQVFFVRKKNVFTRYSEAAKGNIEVECMGLVLGLNMPPITDHFHWCRSTLSYQV